MITEIKKMELVEILGLSESSVRIKFVDFLIILLKYVIFKSRNTGILPSFNAIQNQLLDYMNQEKKCNCKKKIGVAFNEMGICYLRKQFGNNDRCE